MNKKLIPYMYGQYAYSEISKHTGIPENECRDEIESAWRLLNPSGQIILYPEYLPWHLLEVVK